MYVYIYIFFHGQEKFTVFYTKLGVFPKLLDWKLVRPGRDDETGVPDPNSVDPLILSHIIYKSESLALSSLLHDCNVLVRPKQGRSQSTG